MFDRHTEGATSYFPPEKARGESGTERRKLKETGSDSESGKEETLLKQQPDSREASCLCHLSSFVAVSITFIAQICAFFGSAFIFAYNLTLFKIRKGDRCSQQHIFQSWSLIIPCSVGHKELLLTLPTSRPNRWMGSVNQVCLWHVSRGMVHIASIHFHCIARMCSLRQWLQDTDFRSLCFKGMPNFLWIQVHMGN